MASPALSNLLLSGSEFGVGGLGLAGPLLNAQSLGFEQRAAEAQARQVVAQYEQTILVAFKEVEDALVAVRTVNDQRKAQEEQVKALRSALNVANLSLSGWHYQLRGRLPCQTHSLRRRVRPYRLPTASIWYPSSSSTRPSAEDGLYDERD